jgi:hypothetical protein
MFFKCFDCRRKYIANYSLRLQLSCQLLTLPNGFWAVVVVGVWKNQSTTINLCKTSSRKLPVQRFDEEETLEIQGKFFECRINQSTINLCKK